MLSITKLKRFTSFDLVQSEQGFTIAELLVATGIMGIVALGVMNLNHFLTRETRSTYLRSEINFFDQKISQILATKDNCEATIKTTDPVIPVKGATPAFVALSSIRTSDGSISYLADAAMPAAKRLDKQVRVGDAGAVSGVWIKSIDIGQFTEIDYAEYTTAKTNQISNDFADFNTYDRTGWALIRVLYYVKIRTGSKDTFRSFKGEYPVVVTKMSNGKIRNCVDSYMRTAQSAIETLCIDLGGSVTFINGEPECYGGINSGVRENIRDICTNLDDVNAGVRYRSGICRPVGTPFACPVAGQHLVMKLNGKNEVEYECQAQ